MTEENRTTETETSETPKFGTGDKQPEKPQDTESTQEASFGKEDIEKLAKMNHDAQDFIKTLQTETATLRNEVKTLQEELAKSRTIDDLLDSYGTRQHDDNSNSTGPKTPQLDEQELLAKLKEEVFRDMSQAQKAELETKNWNESLDLLHKQLGDGYAKYVDNRANELGMSNEDMESLARTRPKAFVELVVGRSTARNPEPTRSSQKSLYSDPSADLEVRYARVSRLRHNVQTEEGREANRMWNDPNFQSQYREHILEKARREGSKFGNLI